MGIDMSKTVELSEPISLRLPVDLLASLETVAAASDRTRSWVLVRALRRYMATEGADILAIDTGKRQIAAGEAHDFDSVLDEVEALVRSGKAA
jgi:predicted transcriptional regulator